MDITMHTLVGYYIYIFLLWKINGYHYIWAPVIVVNLHYSAKIKKIIQHI